MKAPAPPPPGIGLRFYTPEGARKYVTAGERQAFLRAAEQAERRVRTLCMTLAYAGCRLSEALALTVDRVDLAAACWCSRASRNGGAASTAPCRCRLSSSKRST